MQWHVLVPLKSLALAKSRLDVPPDLRRALVVGMATDVLAAALAVPRVRVVLVSSDVDAGQFMVPVVRDDAGGLSAAVTTAARAYPGRVAVLPADLPAVTPAQLEGALESAEAHDRSVIADADGTGTTLLAASHGPGLAASYGPSSRVQHVASGAVDLTHTVGSTGMRRDVDTLEDLAAALALGVGPATRAALQDPGWRAVHLAGP